MNKELECSQGTAMHGARRVLRIGRWWVVNPTPTSMRDVESQPGAEGGGVGTKVLANNARERERARARDYPLTWRRP